MRSGKKRKTMKAGGSDCCLPSSSSSCLLLSLFLLQRAVSRALQYKSLFHRERGPPQALELPFLLPFFVLLLPKQCSPLLFVLSAQANMSLTKEVPKHFVSLRPFERKNVKSETQFPASDFPSLSPFSSSSSFFFSVSVSPQTERQDV